MRYSNLNLPPKVIALGEARDHVLFMYDVHDGAEDPVYAGGFDITPTRLLMHDVANGEFAQLLPGPGAPEASRGRWQLVSGVHQTWPEYPWRDLGHALSITNWKGLAALPETHKSLSEARRMSVVAGNVPLCVYPEPVETGEPAIDFWQYGARNAAQVSPEALDLARAGTNVSELGSFLWQQGIQGVIIDNHHLTREDLPWESILSELGESDIIIAGLHAAAGRIDSKHEGDRERSMQELAAWLEGPEALSRTAMGEILGEAYRQAQARRQNHVLAEASTPPGGGVSLLNEAGYKSWYYAQTPAALPVTVEVPYAGLVALRQAKLSRMDVVHMTRDLGQGMREFLAGHSLVSAAV